MQNVAFRQESGQYFSPALCVRCGYAQKDGIKSNGGLWNPMERLWELPYTPEDWQSILLSVPGVCPDDSIRQDLMAEENDLLREIPEAPPMPLKNGITPFRHQLGAYSEAFSRFRDAPGGYGLLFEMGCGKSLTAVGIAGALYQHQLIRKALVVAPLAVCPVWPREFTDYAGFPFAVSVLSGAGTEKKKQELMALERDHSGLLVAVVNYESAWRIADTLKAWKPELIIADESQRIKDPLSRQSKAMHDLARVASYRLILTGTPVNNSPLDFFSQYKFLDSSIFGDSWYSFRSRYAVTGSEVNRATGKSYTTVLGYRNLSELVQKAHASAYRVTKEAALDLPEQTSQYLYCQLEPAARKAYDDLRKNAIAELSGFPAVTAQHVITRLLRLSQICGGYVRTDIDGYEDDPQAGKLILVSKAKRKLFEETAADILEQGKKLIVFARFTAEIHDIVEILGKLIGSENLRLIDGSVPGKERGKAVEDFQTDSTVRAFVAQLQTAGLGITLTAADTAIYYSYSYSYADYEQSLSRNHRIGQKNACTYIHLVVENSVDEEVINALKFKANVADMVVDRWQELLKCGYLN